MSKQLIVPLLILFLTSTCVKAECDVSNRCDFDEAANLTLMVFNRTDYSVLTGANCTVDIIDPSRNYITNDADAYEEGNGVYYYNLSGTEVNQTGLYEGFWNCTDGTDRSFEPLSYEIVDWMQQDYFTQMISYITNSTSVLYDNILNYLQGQLETTLASDTVETIAQTTWNDTVVEDRGVTSNPQCENRPIFNIQTGMWETEC